MAHFARLKDLKKGDFFVFPTSLEIKSLSPVNLFNEYFFFEPSSNRVRVRGSYNRSSKKYSCYLFDDVCRESFRKGNIIVITDFIF